MNNKEAATALTAWHGNPAIKAKYVERVKAHALAEEIAQGVYYELGSPKPQMCGVGCTIHSSDHSRYETEMGIPTQIAYIEDGVFEALPLDQAKAFPLAFVQAIEPGADLSMVTSRLMLDILVDESNGLLALPNLPNNVLVAIDAVARCYRNRLDDNEPAASKWKEVEKLARDARDARDAWDARAAWAAWAAAWAARDAWAAWAAWAAAWAARDALDAWDDARDATSIWQRDRLLHHLRDAPVVVTQGIES